MLGVMLKKMMQNFEKELARFREWALVHAGMYGEWECDYEHWDELWSATEQLMERAAANLPDAKTTNDLLYTIARDNEIERLREELIRHPDLLRHLARHGIESSDVDARWQIAVSVAEAKLPDAADLIRPYLSDVNEYVRRRSLLAFAPFSPTEAEDIAKSWMDEEYEYSRIAGIHVLDIIDSESLGFYLQRYKDDPNQYVRSNVDEIRKRRHET